MSRPTNALLFLLGAGAGAGIMYLFDPLAGTRRRARLQDQTASALRRGGRTLGKAARELRNRARGAATQLQAGDLSDAPSDPTLAEGLQGELESLEVSNLEPTSWGPAPRLMFGTLGSALLAYGLLRRGRTAIPLASIGAGLLARSVGNVPLRGAVRVAQELAEREGVPA
jgi:hypothetical protein